MGGLGFKPRSVSPICASSFALGYPDSLTSSQSLLGNLGSILFFIWFWRVSLFLGLLQLHEAPEGNVSISPLPRSPKLTFLVNFCPWKSNLKGLTFVLFCEGRCLLSYSVLSAKRDDFRRPGTWGDNIGSRKIQYSGSVRVMDKFN